MSVTMQIKQFRIYKVIVLFSGFGSLGIEFLLAFHLFGTKFQDEFRIIE